MRGGVRELGLDYAAAVPCDLLAAPVGSGMPDELRRGRRGEARAGAARVDVLARALEEWRAVGWRGGAAGGLGGRVAPRRTPPRPAGFGPGGGCWARTPTRPAPRPAGLARRSGCWSRTPTRPATAATG